MAVEVDLTRAFKAGLPKVLFTLPVSPVPATSARWDVAADGKRFLVVTNYQTAPAAAVINVVLDWPALLKK